MKILVFGVGAIGSLMVHYLCEAGDVKMYNRDEILELVKAAGFEKVKYRKISPFTFQCIAKK